MVNDIINDRIGAAPDRVIDREMAPKECSGLRIRVVSLKKKAKIRLICCVGKSR